MKNAHCPHDRSMWIWIFPHPLCHSIARDGKRILCRANELTWEIIFCIRHAGKLQTSAKMTSDYMMTSVCLLRAGAHWRQGGVSLSALIALWHICNWSLHLHATSSEFNARRPSSLPWITFWRLRVVDNIIRLLNILQNVVFGDKSRIALCYLTWLALTVVRLLLHLRRFLFSNTARLKPAFGFWQNKRISFKEQR